MAKKTSDFEDTKRNVPIDEKQEEKLLKQIDNEYTLSKDFLRPRITEWLKRLKLYNNQKRDQTAVGDPLLFTVMNALLASLYDDRLGVLWQAKEQGDLEVEEHLNELSEYDYDVMDKPELDYDWLWDTLFFSYGIVNLTYFNRKTQTPEPELLDPATFLYDPGAESIDGDGKANLGGMRFCGSELQLTKPQMEKLGYINIDKVKAAKTVDDLTKEATEARVEAMGYQYNAEEDRVELGDNTQYRVLEWRTWFDGKRVIVVLANDLTEIIRYQPLTQDTWGLVSKRVWPIAHQFQGVSVPDLVEDKQRMRSVVTNLGTKALKSDIYPMYAYDSDKIKNKGDLKFGFNHFIPVDGIPSNVITPISKASPNMNLYDYIMQILDTGAQRATATPELQQGLVSKEARTLGELNLVAQKVDTRYSLVVKNLMKGEKDFWRKWYGLYKRYFKDSISKKVVRLSGVLSGQFREFTRENLISEVDPDVEIESKILSEAKQMKRLARFMQLIQMVGADPTTNRRYAMKEFARLTGMERDEVDKLFPETLDEMLAKEQNEELNENRTVPVKPEDNHQVHIEIHGEANATDATFAHIETHKQALVLQRERPELFPHLQQQMTPDEAQGYQPGQQGQPEGDTMAVRN